MFHAMTGCAMLALCPLSAVAQAPAERPPAPGTPATIPVLSKEIMPGLFLFTGRGGNAVVRATPDGLIAVDNKVMRESVFNELRDAIAKRAGDQPIKVAFITHHHADHGGSNARIRADGAELIGHSNLPAILTTYTSTIAPRNPAPPSITFEREHRVTLGGVEAIAYHWGPGHTGADIAVYFPDQRVVVAGDMLHMAGDPAIDILDGGGSLIGFRDRIDDLLKLDFVLAIPGHGENAVTRDEVKLYRQRIQQLIDRGIAAVRRGVKPDDLRDAMRSDDLGFRLVGHFWTDPRYIAPIHAELLNAAGQP
ncbi:MBL fold metallo-hydrolase [Sphingomonas sp.]|uniref:MBL fold metallo-hydrolase n=1 Tax=Sphingomonas sp. TaxID=28214 RepID=UPI002DD664FB|nr:MBL fold metallo-hydrolase [Sphingomonas sp.]